MVDSDREQPTVGMPLGPVTVSQAGLAELQVPAAASSRR